MRPSLPFALGGAASLALLVANFAPLLPLAPPTDVQLPGTQPLQAPLSMGSAQSCRSCHGNYDPQIEPNDTWFSGMMAQATRDPVFHAALAVAEEDFPGSGDFCIRCHAQRAWHEGRATPSDLSGLDPQTDADGVECAICHNMVNQNTQEHAGIQTAPYEAHDGGSPPTGYYGSGTVVLAGDDVRHGPYAWSLATHAATQSQFLRSPDFCGTCHDVSNPAVGDLAPGNGAQVPLPAGSYSGIAGSPVAGKAAFNNFPYQYGIVERTYSEHVASAFPTTPVSSYSALPSELQRGAIARARGQALLAGRNGDYEDGTTRYFTCQTCHMEPVVGEGAAFGLAPLRTDLPVHDLTGGNTWVPEAIKWLDGQGRLRFGGLTPPEIAALDRGVLRARARLQRAAALDVSGDTVRVVNLTGHKLISGYPEGRRMWLRVRWMDEQSNLLREDGSYDTFTATVNGTGYAVSSITDPNARIYEAKMGISQAWAARLVNLGWAASLALAYDRVSGAVTKTLGQLASDPPGSAHESFHFVLADALISDTRIPPYGFDHDEARVRNALPEPPTQYGNPGPNGVYDHFDDVALSPPAGATRAEIELLYQTASWEYVQFLRLANQGTSPFLASAGVDLLDAWLNTGQSPPEQMALARWCDLPGTGEDLVLRSAVNGAAPDRTCGKRLEHGDTVTFEVTSPNSTFAQSLGALIYELHDAAAPPVPFLPGIWLGHADAVVTLAGVTAGGATDSITIPAWLQPIMVRAQAVALSTGAANGTYAASDALDVWL